MDTGIIKSTTTAHYMRKKYGISMAKEDQIRLVIGEFLNYLNSRLTDRSR